MNDIKKVARWMKLKKFKFDSFAKSPRNSNNYRFFSWSGDKLTTLNELASDGDPDRICHIIAQYGKNATVLLIGHDPSLSMLMSKIMYGNGNGSFVLAKGDPVKIQDVTGEKILPGNLYGY
ncbi:MAG: hypothetical protein LUQ04_05570 [Methanoregula sp.]|nr:hypothetical protein [Methanoregula sp.]